MAARPRRGGAVGLRQGVKVHGATIEHVEDAVANGGFKHQRNGVAPGKLHDAFGRNMDLCRRGRDGCHGLLTSKGNLEGVRVFVSGGTAGEG